MQIVLFILISLLCFVRLENPCPEFITCESSETAENCPKNTYYRERVKLNGCCPGCVTLKGENEICVSSADCQPALKCDSTKKCVKDPAQACEYYKRYDPTYVKTKYWNPSCLPDGTYAPKQCKGEKIMGKCFCVDKMGKRIFGEEEWDKAENMTCACSRLAEEMKQTNSHVTLHCDPMGNFEPLQCDEKVCWCASPKTGLPYTIVVPSSMMIALPCYNIKVAGVQYFKQCDSMSNQQYIISTLLNDHGAKDVTIQSYRCNYDGSYHRVQDFKNKQRCAFLNNFPITEPVASNNTNCNCAYDRYLAEIKRVEFIWECLPNGNYRNRQYWNGQIFCVDDDGVYYSKDPNDCA